LLFATHLTDRIIYQAGWGLGLDGGAKREGWRKQTAHDNG
jgi:hypothetical protein